jgi:hypothetical protein
VKAVSLKGASKLPPSTRVLFVLALAHFIKLEQKRKLQFSSLREYTERSFRELCFLLLLHKVSGLPTISFQQVLKQKQQIKCNTGAQHF